MAEDGIRFEKAYSANPVCVPSRISMVNGRYARAVLARGAIRFGYARSKRLHAQSG